MKITKNITTYIFGLVLMMTTAAVSMEVRAGLSLNADAVYLSGSETLKDSGKQTQMNEAGLFHYGSIFGELATDAGFAIGVEYAPEYADLPRETRIDCSTLSAYSATKTDRSSGACQSGNSGVANGAVAAVDAKTNTVDAKVSDALTAYVHVPVGDSGLYGKIGAMFAEIVVNENLGTGSSYGDVDAQAMIIGMGYSGDLSDNMFWRVEGSYMQFENIKERGSQAGGTATSFNSIAAEMAGAQGKLSVGMAF